MARTVLLIEPDVDVLGALASKLRARGLEIWIADSAESAVARARSGLPDIVLVSAGLETEVELSLEEVSGLGIVPRFVLSDSRAGHEASVLPRSDPDVIAQKLHALLSASPNAAPEVRDFRGDFSQVSLADLLQLLSANRQSGVLTLQTPLGAGEVRLREGQVEDALYRRLEGRKALYRLLGERDGTFSFVAGIGEPLFRRIEAPTQALLMEGMREIDEAQRSRDALDLGDDALIALIPADTEGVEVRSMVLSQLSSPRTLSELLDEVPALDAEVLAAVTTLVSEGSVRRIAGYSHRVELADPDRLQVLAALTKRVARPGFRGASRVGIAASSRRLLGIMASLGRIAEAMIPTEAVPTAPVPHVLATLRLGDGIDLDVLGIPLVEAYAPFWSLVLPGCTALAIAEDGPQTTLEAACQLAGIPWVALGDIAETREVDAEGAAQLIQRLLESAAGG